MKPFPLPPEREAKIKELGLESYEYVRPRGGCPSFKNAVRARVRKLAFLLYKPKGAGERFSKPLPLIVYLCGIGGRGHDNWRIVEEDGGGIANTAGNLINEDWQKYMPCYVLIPQPDEVNNWWPQNINQPSIGQESAGNVVDVLKATSCPDIDMSRLYITGLSGGAFGCFAMVESFPGKFAAIVPIAGYCGQAGMYSPWHVPPMWMFWNDGDESVSWNFIRWTLNAYEDYKGDARLTIYKNARGHNSWARTYQDGEFRKWLQRQKLKDIIWPTDTSVVIPNPPPEPETPEEE